MKVIAFEREPGTIVSIPPALTLIADSALVLHGNPLFLPDFSQNWIGEFYIAFRISRLGKAIRAKFASRYYDGVTLALRALPADTIAELNATRDCAYPAGGLLGVFDNCLVPGEWQEVPTPGEPLTITIGDNSMQLTMQDIEIDKAVETISAYTTLKTGDMIMPCRLPLSVPLSPEAQFVATVNGAKILTARIK